MNRFIKRIVAAFFVCVVATAAMAQNKSGIKVEYDYHFFTIRGYEVNRPMILTCSSEKSKFYNPETNRIDSISDSPEGYARLEALKNTTVWTRDNQKNYPARWEKMYVEKNRLSGTMRVYDTVAGEDRMFYDEPLVGMNWEITDCHDNILGYDCQVAECDYNGRHWTAWFTEDVPVSEGPWKLNGLPGLILKAKETSGQYEFTATGIEAYDKEIEPVYEKGRYEKTNRIELLQTKRMIDENMGGFISARINTDHPIRMKSTELKGSLDYLENDYR